jgi:hypothetical protein
VKQTNGQIGPIDTACLFLRSVGPAISDDQMHEEWIGYAEAPRRGRQPAPGGRTPLNRGFRLGPARVPAAMEDPLIPRFEFLPRLRGPIRLPAPAPEPRWSGEGAG